MVEWKSRPTAEGWWWAYVPLIPGLERPDERGSIVPVYASIAGGLDGPRSVSHDRLSRCEHWFAMNVDIPDPPGGD